MKAVSCDETAVFLDHTFITMDHRDKYLVYSLRVTAGSGHRMFTLEAIFDTWVEARTFSRELNEKITGFHPERFLEYSD